MRWLKRRRWLKRSSLCAAVVVCAWASCVGTASAQQLSPGYTFADVTDEADQPVAGAVAVVYKESGEEAATTVTIMEGRASLMVNGYEKKRFVFRIIKPCYRTYEGAFETSGKYTPNTIIRVKLVSLCKPKPKPSGTEQKSPTPSSTPRPAPPPSGPSPPTPRANSCRVPFAGLGTGLV